MKDDKTWLFRALKNYMRYDTTSNSWDQEMAIDELISALDDHIDSRIKEMLSAK
jgi:hypothetical protein